MNTGSVPAGTGHGIVSDRPVHRPLASPALELLQEAARAVRGAAAAEAHEQDGVLEASIYAFRHRRAQHLLVEPSQFVFCEGGPQVDGELGGVGGAANTDFQPVCSYPRGHLLLQPGRRRDPVAQVVGDPRGNEANAVGAGLGHHFLAAPWVLGKQEIGSEGVASLIGPPAERRRSQG